MSFHTPTKHHSETHLIRQQLRDPMRKRIHRNPRAPQHKIRRDRLLLELSRLLVLHRVHDLVGPDEGDAGGWGVLAYE